MEKEIWYNSQLFSAIIGAIATLLVMIITNYINEKNKLSNDKREMLALVTQCNPKLFSIIFKASINSNKFDYINLRKELDNCSIVWILPQNVKDLFVKLYEIHNFDAKKYEENKSKIINICKEISNELMKYGVDSNGIFK